MKLTSSLNSFEGIVSAARGKDVVAQVARQYLIIKREIGQKNAPTILELGTRDGVSTRVFLEVCRQSGGRVVSVDIENCDHVAIDPNWQFVQSDSRDADRIIELAPILKKGIDILLIDTVHERRHVAEEIAVWYSYLNQGAMVFIDDVDPFIYRVGQRKDNFAKELRWQSVQDFCVELFRANEDSMSLRIHFGSSGLAVMEKRVPRGTPLTLPRPQIYRDRLLRYRLPYLMRRAAGVWLRNALCVFSKKLRA